MDSNHRPHAYQACALNQLSYRPINYDKAGNENRTRDNSLEGYGFTTKLYPHKILNYKWRGTESNCRHTELQSVALPTELPSHIEAVRTRLELVISCVTGRRPNQLDQRTKLVSIAGAGFEPTTSGL